MHNREYTVILRPHEGGIMLHTIYYKNEVRQVEGFGGSQGRSEGNRGQGGAPVDSGPFRRIEPEKYHDTFEDNLKAEIKAHLEGKEVSPVAKPSKVAPVTDLMAALKQSLAGMEGQEGSPQRVEVPLAAGRAHAKSAPEETHKVGCLA